MTYEFLAFMKYRYYFTIFSNSYTDSSSKEWTAVYVKVTPQDLTRTRMKVQTFGYPNCTNIYETALAKVNADGRLHGVKVDEHGELNHYLTNIFIYTDQNTGISVHYTLDREIVGVFLPFPNKEIAIDWMISCLATVHSISQQLQLQFNYIEDGLVKRVYEQFPECLEALESGYYSDFGKNGTDYKDSSF